MVTFDPANRLIIIDTGVTAISVREVYSAWKDWIHGDDGSKYDRVFSVVGGDPVNEAQGIFITSYFFLQGGWRIRPDEADHQLVVGDGILLTSEGDSPFVPTVGTFNVLVQYSQPILSETIATGGGPAPPTPAQIAAAVWDREAALHMDAGSFGLLINEMADTLGGMSEAILAISRLTGNRVTRTGDAITIYEEDGTTVWRQYNLADGGRVQL